MGKVTVFCLLSGCTPEILTLGLPYVFEDAPAFDSLDEDESESVDGDLTPGPILKSALDSLADAHELASADDLAVIGAIHPSGTPFYDGSFTGAPDGPHGALARINPDQDVRVIPHCKMGWAWDFGSVEAPAPPDATQAHASDYCPTYLVSFGCCVMVQTYALEIANLATRGRLTPVRLWKLAMRQGYWEPHYGYGLSDVDYRELALLMGQFPHAIPRMRIKDLRDLNMLGDVEAIKRWIIHEGWFWVWMAPDRFPLSPTSPDLPPFTLSDPDPSTPISPIENLPSELLQQIVSSPPLLTIIALASTSRLMRIRILGSGDLARSWLRTSAPWWVPVPTLTPRIPEDVSGGASTSSESRTQTGARDLGPTRGNEDPSVDWGYIRRCTASGSMRNRQRIWHVVLDVERVADLAGV